MHTEESQRLSGMLPPTPMTKNEIGTIIIAAAIDVHRELGPGLL